MTELYSFKDHPDHEARLPEWRDRWIAIALRTKPQGEDDREICRASLKGLYEAADLTPPTRGLFAASPISGAIAAVISSCIWWLRETPERHVELFGAALSEEEIIAAVLPACRRACGEHDPAATIALALAAAGAASPGETENERILDVASFYLQALPHWGRLLNGGNMWAGWCAYLSFFRVVAELKLPQYEKWIHYENAAIHGSYRYLHKHFWIVSDFPTRLCRDEENRPHSSDGPSIAWSDGWAAYYWRGVEVPKEWILSPTKIDPKVALTHDNVELRRCAAEIMGWDRVLGELSAKSIDKDPDPQIGELVEVEIEGNRERFLRVVCGTGRKFALPVPPEMQTALEANAWTYGVGSEDLRKLEVRT